MRLLTLLLITLMIPFALPAESANKTPVQLSLSDDGREWVMVRQEDINGQGIAEYMLVDQNEGNWTELVTLQYFWSDTLQPKELFNLFMTELKAQMGTANVTQTILEENRRNILAEWQIEGSDNDQYELIRIFGDGEKVAIIRYTTKLDRVSQKNINTWKEIIKKASLDN